MNKTALLAAFSTVLGSCVVDNTVDRLSKTEIFLQEPNSLVDILFVVDSSPSMADEQQLIADGFESFIGTLEESNADFQLGVIDMDMDLENSKRAMLIGNPPFLTPEDDYIAGFNETPFNSEVTNSIDFIPVVIVYSNIKIPIFIVLPYFVYFYTT